MTNPKISLNVEPSEITTQYRKELLMRRSSGKHTMPTYIKKITSLLNIKEHDIKLLSLFGSDNIFFNKDYNKEYNKEYNIIREKTYSLSEYSKLYQILIEVLEEKDFYVFVDDDWKNCGALILTERYKLNLDFGLENYEINNEIHFISTDQKVRLLLDYTSSGDKSFIEYISYESND